MIGSREEFYTRLGQKLEAKRKQQGLSQGEVGNAVGAHRNSVYRWEAGTEISLFDFLRICQALSMPHTMMLPGDELPSRILLRQLIRERDPRLPKPTQSECAQSIREVYRAS